MAADQHLYRVLLYFQHFAGIYRFNHTRPMYPIPERDYVTFGFLLSQIRLSSVYRL